MIARDWTYVTGAYLGSCESRMAAGVLPAEALDAARGYLASIDVSAVEPDAERVASELVAVGRANDVGRLIAGASASDFEVHHQGPLWSSEWLSDARILQDGLVQSVFSAMAADVVAQYPELSDAGIQSNVETHCTTDPSAVVNE